MKNIFTRLLNDEIECTSSHKRPWLVTFASEFDICGADGDSVSLGDSPFQMEECLEALFGNVGYVVAFDHGQGVRLYSKDGEPLPSIDEAVSGTFNKNEWRLLEKQPITKTIMDQIQGLEGEVLVDKLRELAQVVENNMNGRDSRNDLRDELEPGSIVMVRGHLAYFQGLTLHKARMHHSVKFVTGQELLVLETDIASVRNATTEEKFFFLHMCRQHDAVSQNKTFQGFDFTSALSDCPPDIQRQATYWHSSGRHIAMSGGLPDTYKETSQNILVKESKQTPKQEVLRSWTVCKHRPSERLCCVSHEGGRIGSDSYWCIFVDGSRACIHIGDLAPIHAVMNKLDQTYFKHNNDLGGASAFSVLERHPH